MSYKRFALVITVAPMTALLLMLALVRAGTLKTYNLSASSITPSPTLTPASTPAPTPEPSASPTPSAKKHHHRRKHHTNGVTK